MPPLSGCSTPSQSLSHDVTGIWCHTWKKLRIPYLRHSWYLSLLLSQRRGRCASIRSDPEPPSSGRSACNRRTDGESRPHAKDRGGSSVQERRKIEDRREAALAAEEAAAASSSLRATTASSAVMAELTRLHAVSHLQPRPSLLLSLALQKQRPSPWLTLWSLFVLPCRSRKSSQPPCRRSR